MLIDMSDAGVNLVAMDGDDLLPAKRDDTLAALAREDLDPLSVDELQARIGALEAEIGRVRAKMKHAVNHKLAADLLFKR